MVGRGLKKKKKKPLDGTTCSSCRSSSLNPGEGACSHTRVPYRSSVTKHNPGQKPHPHSEVKGEAGSIKPVTGAPPHRKTATLQQVKTSISLVERRRKTRNSVRKNGPDLIRELQSRKRERGKLQRKRPIEGTASNNTIPARDKEDPQKILMKRIERQRSTVTRAHR